LYYEKETNSISFIAGIAIGAVLGASIALLTAPQAGKRTRRQVIRALESARDNAGEEWEGVSGRMSSLVRKGRRRMRR
jgi:gas vesicle protein